MLGSLQRRPSDARKQMASPQAQEVKIAVRRTHQIVLDTGICGRLGTATGDDLGSTLQSAPPNSRARGAVTAKALQERFLVCGVSEKELGE